MKAIFRNFIHVLRRFKTASVLNILGLSAALVVFIVCMIQVRYDLTFNHYFTQADELYLLSVYHNTTEGEIYDYRLSNQNAEILRNNLPAFNKNNNTQVHSSAYYRMNVLDTEEYFLENLLSVESSFPDLFDIEVIQGNVNEILSDYNKLMISEKTAKKIFGDINPIGKTIIVSLTRRVEEKGRISSYDDETPMVIEAVYKDFPGNTSFDNGFITLLKPDRFEFYTASNNWSWDGTMRNYCRIANKKQKEELEAILNDSKIMDLLNIRKPRLNNDNVKTATTTLGKATPASEVLETKLKLIPISNIQLHYPEENENGKEKTMSSVLSLLAIGIVTLLIAYINFMNFMTAMAPSRLKTINIQKILGGGRFMQGISVVAEAVFLTLIAVCIALLILSLISSSSIFNQLLKADIGVGENLWVIIGLVIGVVFIAIVVSIYPAVYLTAFKPVVSYSGIATKKSGKGLRNVLTVLQFTVAIVLIMVALFIKIQHNYMKYNNMGLKKENVVYVDNMTAKYEKKIEVPQTYLKEAIVSPYILDGTIANYELGTGWLTHNGGYNSFGEHYGAYDIIADRNFVDFFGLKVIQNKQAINSDEEKVLTIYNQTFMNSISEQFRNEIEGSDALIVEDFNFDKMQKPIKSLRITLDDTKGIRFFYFKLPKEGFNEGMKHLEATWKKLTNEPFELKFLDEELGKQYKDEENLATLLTTFSFIVILIAIMGVYGLITFNSKYRAKEIAIRKVQGSTIEQILLLLNKGILTQFIFSFIIAVPLTYYIVNKWLEQFAYKTPVYWWVFVLGALIVLLITILTVSVQSYRAATANPIGALKNE